MIRLAALLICLAAPLHAQDAAPRASVTGAAGQVTRSGAEVTVGLSRAVPWRIFVEENPWRLVIDTSEVDWTGLDEEALAAVGPVRSGRVRPGWSRLSIGLSGPARVERAWMQTGEAPAMRVTLEDGAGPTGPLVSQGWELAREAVPTMPRRRRTGSGSLVVALDPGHGGIDPGAERGGMTEAALMLGFAGELAAMLREAGHTAVLTRQADEFVGLRGRTSIARAAGADLLISLHADAVEGGGAEGATVYTMSTGSGEALAAELAQRHGRDDLLLGVELQEQGDEIAEILVQLARAETMPRADSLADALVASLAEDEIRLHKRPRLAGEFTVLKAPDIPSVLLELGFMSDERDLTNLASRTWRSKMAAAIVRGIETWAVSDAAQAARLRR